MTDASKMMDDIAQRIATQEAELKARQDKEIAKLFPSQEELATMSSEERMDRARKILRAKGLGHLAGDTRRTVTAIANAERINRPMRMAAMYLLGASLSQLAMLFGVARGSARDATLRYIDMADREARPQPQQSQPLISNEMASLYYNKILSLPPMASAHDLAWAVQDSITASEHEAATDRLDP